MTKTETLANLTTTFDISTSKGQRFSIDCYWVCRNAEGKAVYVSPKHAGCIIVDGRIVWQYKPSGRLEILGFITK